MDSYTILMRCNFKENKILLAQSENKDNTSIALAFRGGK